ncbi:hypothetical protein DPMN_183865 [Dreissena polymorpha]|uniref:Uncharacterized protein n=1 Tax=Dreissena polymorpha TaxID=45954 RepID=A0A9D4DI52_DREPO|nr:hypothetical protein DPMN_183865 [Dreissena polymorpha]
MFPSDVLKQFTLNSSHQYNLCVDSTPSSVRVYIQNRCVFTTTLCADRSSPPENASYIHIEKTVLSPCGHVFPLITTIFKLIQHINQSAEGTEDHFRRALKGPSNKTNVLTKFHDDWPKNVTLRLAQTNQQTNRQGKNNMSPTTIRKLPPGGHVFSLITTIFKLNQDIHKTNLWTKKKTPPPSGHVFLLIQTIFELNCRIQETNVLIKFHKDWAKNVSSRLFTCFHNIHIEKTAPSPGGHVFPLIMTICKIVRDIHITNEKNGTSRVFTMPNPRRNVTNYYIPSEFFFGGDKRKKTPPPGGHVFLRIRTIFELNQNCPAPVFSPIITIFELVRDIYKIDAKNVTSRETNVLTKCHEDLTKNVTSRVCICFHYIHIEKTAPPPGGHVFSQIWTIFELVQDINKTNVLTKFHDDWAKIVTSRVFTRNIAPSPGGHVFHWTKTIFELNQHIIKTNILTNFKLRRGIIGTNVLTKFHEDWTINVASRVFTRQMLTTDAQRTTDIKTLTKAHHEHVVLR